MLTALGVVVLVVASSVPLLVVGSLLALAEWAQRRRRRVIFRQVALTDAVHRELGPIVAPVVEKRPWGPWRAVMTLSPSRFDRAPRLAAIALEVLGAQGPSGPRMEVVFRPGDEDSRPLARTAGRRRAA
jgi:hypothetical protein